MASNPFLKKLGYSDTERLVILHTDDIGMCHASVQAYMDLWNFGTITSGAVMVPCPWFPAVAKICRENPDMDMGVHVTLNSEWDTYRWRPLSTLDPDSGLLDEEGKSVYHYPHIDPIYHQVHFNFREETAHDPNGQVRGTAGRDCNDDRRER